MVREADQRARLRLDGGLATAKHAATLLATVGVMLRYGPGKGLPIASLYAAIGDDRRATVIANQLIEDGLAIETNAIADRVALLDARLAPALVALVRHGEPTETAQRALGYIANAERPTAGQVRAFLGVPPKTWPNPADEALAELQRLALIERGPTAVPATGAAYLGKDGIPYRIFDRAHPSVAKAAAKLTRASAAVILLDRYLAGALFGTRRKLASMFGLAKPVLDAAIEALVATDRATVDKQLVISGSGSTATDRSSRTRRGS